MTYDYRRYNQYDVLKPHWGFWVTLLFLSRHVVGFVLISMSGSGIGNKGGGVGRDAIDLGSVISLIEPIFMFADIPALMVLYALGSRLPKAGPGVRYVWRAGRALIVSSVGIYLALFAYSRGVDFATYDTASWVSLALSVVAAAYALVSPYMKDLFQQFPAPEDGGT